MNKVITSWGKDIIRTELAPKWKDAFDDLCKIYEYKIEEQADEIKRLNKRLDALRNRSIETL